MYLNLNHNNGSHGLCEWLWERGSMFDIRKLFKKEHKKPVQRTFIDCSCGNELCSSRSFVSDTLDKNGDNHVLYKCSMCGAESDYNFDIAPVPINWKRIITHL